MEARIMALVDVYEALISERVYKKAFPKEKAIEIIRDGCGTQFDPIITDLFLRKHRTIHKYKVTSSDRYREREYSPTIGLRR